MDSDCIPLWLTLWTSAGTTGGLMDSAGSPRDCCPLDPAAKCTLDSPGVPTPGKSAAACDSVRGAGSRGSQVPGPGPCSTMSDSAPMDADLVMRHCTAGSAGAGVRAGAGAGAGVDVAAPALVPATGGLRVVATAGTKANRDERREVEPKGLAPLSVFTTTATVRPSLSSSSLESLTDVSDPDPSPVSPRRGRRCLGHTPGDANATAPVEEKERERARSGSVGVPGPVTVLPLPSAWTVERRAGPLAGDGAIVPPLRVRGMSARPRDDSKRTNISKEGSVMFWPRRNWAMAAASASQMPSPFSSSRRDSCRLRTGSLPDTDPGDTPLSIDG